MITFFPGDYVIGKVILNPFLRDTRLINSTGELDSSNRYLEEVYNRASSEVDRAQCLKIRGRNKFMANDFMSGLKDTLSALELLGVTINLSPSEEETNALFDRVSGEILELGSEHILNIPRSEDPRAELTMQLLSTAGKSIVKASS